MNTDCLFDDDDDDETIDPALAWARKLIVGEPVESEALCEIEAQYRKHGAPPVMFDDTEADGGWNADLFAKAMNLPAGELPTMDQAKAFQTAWALAGKSPNEGNGR